MENSRIRNGSMTLECAMLMPIILMVIISIIWLMIFMYDRVVINRALIHGVMYCDYVRDENNFIIEKEIEKRINEQLADSIIAVNEVNVCVKVNDWWCKAEIEAQMDIPDGISWLSGISVIKMEKKKDIIYGARVIRLVNRVEKYKNLIDKLGQEGDLSKVEEDIESGD